MVQASCETVLFLTTSALPSAQFALPFLFLFAMINTLKIQTKDMPFFPKI